LIFFDERRNMAIIPFTFAPLKNSIMIGVLKLAGMISDFSVWDDTIHSYVKKFHEQYNVFPNILLANEFTFRKMEFRALMHPERLTDCDGENVKISSVPFTGISSFEANDYSLDFCMDNKLPEGMLMLVFDAAPEFDGEPIPEEIEENEYFNSKCA
jgi:hypothetical protein